MTWTGRLIRYINLYGLKFSKEDHIKFIKLYYDLIIMPGLEASMISLFASTLSSLLKKQYLTTATIIMRRTMTKTIRTMMMKR